MEMMTRVGIYPGSFDPLTLGHLDIIERSLHVVDELIIAVSNNDKKIICSTLTPELNLFMKLSIY